MEEKSPNFWGCLAILGSLIFFCLTGFSIFYFTEVSGKNVSHSQDESRFDPILAEEEIKALAGPGYGLSVMSATHVRSDGTQDFSNKDYPPQTSFTFIGTAASKAPVGAIQNVDGVEVSVRPRGWSKTSTRPGQTNYHYNFGLLRRETVTSGLSVHGYPTCSLQNLWKTALERGAPKDAVASITYQGGVYVFRIAGTEFHYAFDHKCKMVGT